MTKVKSLLTFLGLAPNSTSYTVPDTSGVFTFCIQTLDDVLNINSSAQIPSILYIISNNTQSSVKGLTLTNFYDVIIQAVTLSGSADSPLNLVTTQNVTSITLDSLNVDLSTSLSLLQINSPIGNVTLKNMQLTKPPEAAQQYLIRSDNNITSLLLYKLDLHKFEDQSQVNSPKWILVSLSRSSLDILLVFNITCRT